MKPILPTAEEEQEIQNGNIILVSKYYLLNYDFIKTIAKSYCRKNFIKNKLYEDIAQECFLYFNKFKFKNASSFIRSVYDVAVYVRWGGERVYYQVRQGNTEILTILDEPTARERGHGGEPMTIGETISSTYDIINEIEPPTDYSDDIYKLLSSYMTEREKQAFNYFYYSDLTAREVGANMSLTINGAQSLKNSYMRKLKKNSDLIRVQIEKLKAVEQ